MILRICSSCARARFNHDIGGLAEFARKRFVEAADLAVKGLDFRHECFGIGLAKEGAVDAVDPALRLGDPRDHLADARRFSQEAFFAFGQAIDDVIEPRKIFAGARLARDHRAARALRASIRWLG